nr:hypothetical protein [Nannocystis exedens]
MLDPQVAGALMRRQHHGLVAARAGDHLHVVEELDLDLVAVETLADPAGLDRLDELVEVDRLLDDPHRAAALVLPAELRAQRLDDQHHRDRREVAAEPLKQLGAVARGRVQVAQHDVEQLAAQAIDRLARAAGRGRDVPLVLQPALDRRLQEHVVDHDEGVDHGGRLRLGVLRHAAPYLTLRALATGLLCNLGPASGPVRSGHGESAMFSRLQSGKLDRF